MQVKRKGIDIVETLQGVVTTFMPCMAAYEIYRVLISGQSGTDNGQMGQV